MSVNEQFKKFYLDIKAVCEKHNTDIRIGDWEGLHATIIKRIKDEYVARDITPHKLGFKNLMGIIQCGLIDCERYKTLDEIIYPIERDIF